MCIVQRHHVSWTLLRVNFVQFRERWKIPFTDGCYFYLALLANSKSLAELNKFFVVGFFFVCPQAAFKMLQLIFFVVTLFQIPLFFIFFFVFNMYTISFLSLSLFSFGLFLFYHFGFPIQHSIFTCIYQLHWLTDQKKKNHFWNMMHNRNTWDLTCH